jgi:hypothetical protein
MYLYKNPSYLLPYLFHFFIWDDFNLAFIDSDNVPGGHRGEDWHRSTSQVQIQVTSFLNIKNIHISKKEKT